MSEIKYVYREVVGYDLEKSTADGWEFVSSSNLGSYLVRRPYEMPDVMKLTKECEILKDALNKSQTVREGLSSTLNMIRKSIGAYARLSTKLGRDKPTRDQLVRMFFDLSRGFAE